MRIQSVSTYRPYVNNIKSSNRFAPNFGIIYHDCNSDLKKGLLSVCGPTEDREKYQRIFDKLRQSIEEDPLLKTKKNMYYKLLLLEIDNIDYVIAMHHTEDYSYQGKFVKDADAKKPQTLLEKIVDFFHVPEEKIEIKELEKYSQQILDFFRKEAQNYT